MLQAAAAAAAAAGGGAFAAAAAAPASAASLAATAVSRASHVAAAARRRHAAAAAELAAAAAVLAPATAALAAAEDALEREVALAGPGAPFVGPAADSALGERLLDVVHFVAAAGFAPEVSHCINLCGVTWRKGDPGANNDMLVESLERQCGAGAARAAKRAKFAFSEDEGKIKRTTQLIRAAAQNDLPRVLQLVQLGAPLDLFDELGYSALDRACVFGHERIAEALLDGKYEGRGAKMNRGRGDFSALMHASREGREGIVRMLLARGARPEMQMNGDSRWSALHLAVLNNHSGVVALLCAAPGADAALALRKDGRTPLGEAVARGKAACEACEAVLRARGAPM